MKILFVDSDHQHARDLYTQFLSYRGTSWNVVHATTLTEAQEWLAYDQFDVALTALPASGMDQDFYAQFVDRAAAELPVIVLLFESNDSVFVEWIDRGANDCLNGQVANGDYIMRRLRMATSRFYYQKKRLEHHNSVYCRARSLAAQRAVAAGTLDLAADQKLPAASERPTKLAFITDRDSEFQHGLDHAQISVAELDFDHAVEMLSDGSDVPDAIVLEHALAERYGDQRLYRFLQDSPVPVIVLTTEVSDNTALVVVDRGADDCLTTSRTSDADLERALRMAIARRTRVCQRLEECQTPATPVSDRRSESRSRDRRQSPRYLITRPILAIPVLPNGAPDTQGICEAFTIDLSASGIGFQLGLETVLPSRNWVVGIETTQAEDWPQEYHFANVMTRNVTFVPGGVRLGTQFRHPEDDLFRPENLTPRLSDDSYRMVGSLPTHVLDAWCELGVLKPALMHRLKTCPECAAVLVLGTGCLECGSPAIVARELIHHFACALIDDYDKFCTEAGGLKCPKCLTGGLVAGADFEVIKARYRCGDCGGENNELAQVGTCLNCCLRLPVNMASDTEVYGYHVARLDILAYLSSTN